MAHPANVHLTIGTSAVVEATENNVKIMKRQTYGFMDMEQSKLRL